MYEIDSWESEFLYKLEQLDPAQKDRAGVLLSILPDRMGWESFLESVRTEWSQSNGFYSILCKRRHCLIVLFGGVAFFHYEDNTFWPKFAEAIGRDIPPNSQRAMGNDFVNAACLLGLGGQQFKQPYVGLAVFHIGIPISLWGDFLEICEWALLYDEWRKLTDAQWIEAITGRVPTRTRLHAFLTGNRETATEFIREMHDARRLLTEDESLTISGLRQASLLRSEYFDEVPETAEFLRPADPDSLFRDRAKLIWTEERAQICLNLPGVAKENLPATWRIGSINQLAASTPDVCQLNSNAFTKSLDLTLESCGHCAIQRLRGIYPFGLFDCERKRFVNVETYVNQQEKVLPLGHYVLISLQLLDNLIRHNLDETEYPANQLCELSDGSAYHVTHLSPTDKYAEVSFSLEGITQKFIFRTGQKIEARIYVGEGAHAAGFSRYQEWINVERLPLLCLAIPHGALEAPEEILRRKFEVRICDQIMEGVWKKKCEGEDEQSALYLWCWCNEPKLPKKVTVSIKAPALGIGFAYQIGIRKPKPGVIECWGKLPGAFLPWFLLAQPVERMKEGLNWQEMLLAKEAISPGEQLSRFRLREYVNRGLLSYQGHVWKITESRAVWDPPEDRLLPMRYCGNPAILWELYRYLSDKPHYAPLPGIEIVYRGDELPCLRMCWEAGQKTLIEQYFSDSRHYVRVVADLWRP